MSNPMSDPLVETLDSDVDSPEVRIEATSEATATVWINRPVQGNALASETVAALREAFETLHGQDGLRAVFLRGAGGVFCSGADPEWLAETAILTESDHHADAAQLGDALKILHGLGALTVALIQGPALDVGVGLVAACDLAIATADARFAVAEVKRGLSPAATATSTAAVGARTARGLLASGRTLDAEAARAIGLVSGVIADAAALDAAQAQIAEAMSACAPGAVAEAKRTVDDFTGELIDHGLMDDAARRHAHARASEEGREGVAALLEGRPPNWTTF